MSAVESKSSFDTEDMSVYEPYLVLIPPEIQKQSLDEQLTYFKEALPDHLRDLPKEERLEHLEGMLAQFKHLQKHEELLKEHEEYKRALQQNYKPLHQDLYSFSNWKFVDSVNAALADGSPAALKSLLTEEAPGIFSLNLCPVEFCERILEEVAHFEQWCEQNKTIVHRPNSMNRYGAILDDFGFYPVLQELTLKIMNKFSQILFSHVGATLDSHHAFIVEYKIGKDTKLDFHVDDSEVTLNLCLGKQFVGGDLYFGGVRCHEHQGTGTLPEEEIVFRHKVGQAIFHLGKHRHLAKPITEGHRSNFILWCRSSKFRDEESCDHPKWCGLHELLEQNGGHGHSHSHGHGQAHGHGHSHSHSHSHSHGHGHSHGGSACSHESDEDQ